MLFKQKKKRGIGEVQSMYGESTERLFRTMPTMRKWEVESKRKRGSVRANKMRIIDSESLRRKSWKKRKNLLNLFLNRSNTFFVGTGKCTLVSHRCALKVDWAENFSSMSFFHILQEPEGRILIEFHFDKFLRQSLMNVMTKKNETRCVGFRAYRVSCGVRIVCVFSAAT